MIQNLDLLKYMCVLLCLSSIKGEIVDLTPLINQLLNVMMEDNISHLLLIITCNYCLCGLYVFIACDKPKDFKNLYYIVVYYNIWQTYLLPKISSIQRLHNLPRHDFYPCLIRYTIMISIYIYIFSKNLN